MKIAIYGLGYVGCVTAACLSRDGHQVIGVDVNPDKVNMIKAGQSPIIEPGLQELILTGVSAGRLDATTDAALDTWKPELVLVCVGTPSNRNGDIDTRYVENVCRDIGKTLRNHADFTVVVLRSTILPGIALNNLIPIIESESGRKVGEGFGFCVNPEFLREGCAIYDFDNPPFTVIGQTDEESGNRVARLYSDITAPIYHVSIDAAEMLKYTCNAFHALKVVFANEIGDLCTLHGIDSHEVIDIFTQDTKLNISAKYLKPGFSFGGSCLGKDLRALLSSARQSSIRLPVLESILPSNQLRVENLLHTLLNMEKRSIGLIGLSFKPNTDDLRESPAVELAERLIGKGVKLLIYDREVSISHLQGSNRAYIDQTIPHIGTLIRPTLQETIEYSDVIVVTKDLSMMEYETLIKTLGPEQILVDLVRLDGIRLRELKGSYYGISW